MERTELMDKIKQFMYASDLPLEPYNVNLICSTYLKNILIPAYSNNTKSKPYAIIAGDFDKLNFLNRKYGFNNCNKWIAKCLNVISSVLPDDALCIRYAGDEFIFILPSVFTTAEADSYITKINSAISAIGPSTHNMSITLSSSSSIDGNSLMQFDIADKKIADKKDNANGSSLINNFCNSFNSLMYAMRFSKDYNISDDTINRIIQTSDKISKQLISDYYSKENNEHSKDEEIEMSSPDCSFTPEDALRIHSFLLSGKNDGSVSTKDLETLVNSLVFNEHSQSFSKEYFNRFLKDYLPDSNYNTTLFSLSGLKLSNLIDGHLKTDKALYKMYNKLDSAIQQSICCNKTPFAVNSGDSFKIDLRGGDILLVTPEDVELPIRDISSSINSQSDNLLKYATYTSKAPARVDFIPNFLKIAKEKSDSLKNTFKDEFFKNSKFMDLVLNNCLSECIANYCAHHPGGVNSKDLNTFLEAKNRAIYEIAHNINPSNSLDMAHISGDDR